MRDLAEIKNSLSVSSFVARPRLLLGLVIFSAGITLLTLEAASTFYR